MDLCMQMFGEYHILTSRLYINIGMVYEDNNDFKKAYEYFKRWANVSEEILGPEHPKTLRARGVLRETRYRNIARDLGEWQEEDQEESSHTNNEESDDSDETENPDLEHYYDDPIVQISAHQVFSMENSMVQEANVMELVVDHENENNEEELLMNGYFDPNLCEHEHDSSHENSDNENFYDDNFEDYDEHYILHGDSSPVIDDFNVQIYDDEDDEEIVQISSQDLPEGNELGFNEPDNRYVSNRHEGDDETEEQ
ncbi:hypothetical protein CHS0354_021800 [Potamilus streckersoni]|uniref:Kinesin light chain n=1 Tax=Potamilus streckersoni TaxID=2493646 RepID=A0AAE0VP87_9BIVA|nr:hypothetical protein CHS0354_021800 [Potamilus streckersoni]